MKVCTHPGCNVLVHGARCVKHTKHRGKRMEKRSDPFYSSAAWRRTRAWVLQAEPLCRICSSKNRTTLANVVDHIIPRKDRPDLQFSGDNLQPLCERCHNQKTALENQLGHKPEDHTGQSG